MRLTFLFLTIVLAQVSARSFGQRMTLNRSNVPLRVLLKNIRQQSGYDIVYDKKLIKKEQLISIDVKEATIAQVLDAALKNLPVNYEINDNEIIIRRNSTSDVPSNRTEFIDLRGRVLDEKGVSLPGVTVKVKNTNSATVTNTNGEFYLKGVDDNAILVFSFVGYVQQEVRATSDLNNIRMVQSSSKLDEIVIVAYGTQKRSDITGAVQTVSGKDFQDEPAAQLTQKLQGKVAGTQITQNTGVPGQGMAVRIRGAASISAGNAPLYVVDGFPITGDISNINPDEIENISILKDASSTSLYGSRAANGVVLITTKKGKAGGSSIEFNAYHGIQQVPSRGRPEMMDAQQFAQFKKDIALENNQPVDPMFQDPYKYGKGTDWYAALLRTAPIDNYSMSVNFDKDRLKTSATLGYFSQAGVIKNSDYKRFSARINSEYDFNKFIRIGLNLAPTYYYNNQPPTDGNWSILQGAIITSPIAPYKNADGSIPINTSGYGTLDAPNWYNMLYVIKNSTKHNRMLANAYAEVNPIPELTLKTSINIDYNQDVFNNFTPAEAGSFFNPGNSTDPSRIRATVNNRLDYSWLWENTAEYKKNFGKHMIDVLAGYTAQYARGEYSQINASKFPDNLVQTINAASTFTASGSVEEWSLLSLVGRLNYSYSDKYLFSAAVRRDGSSRFGVNRRYGYFPSISAGWIISNEDFMKDLSKLSLLKVRGSYGTIGNNNIGNYTQYATVATTNYPFNNVLGNGRSVAGLNNTDLGWETSRETDIGLDLGLFNNRFTLSYDYYYKTTSNLLYSVDIPISSGFFNYITNIGKIQFSGHEFTLSSKNLTGRFKWNSDFNISFTKNKVLALGTSNSSIYGDFSITKVGQPVGMLYGFVFDGIYNDQATLNNSPKYDAAQVGMIKFKDVNGDGKITFDDRDRAVLGNPTPKFTYGLSNYFNYQNFDLRITLSGQYGNKLVNRIEQYTANLDGAFNVTKDVANRWRSPSSPGAGKYGTTLAGTTFYERDYQNSRFVYDASFLAVKNITIGYRLPVSTSKVIHNMRVFLSGQQLWVFTKYPGNNPEVGGVDLTNYPVPRTITLGVNANL